MNFGETKYLTRLEKWRKALAKKAEGEERGQEKPRQDKIKGCIIYVNCKREVRSWSLYYYISTD